MIGIFVVSAVLGNQKNIGKNVENKIKEKFSNENFYTYPLITSLDEIPSSDTLKKFTGIVIVIATGGTEFLIRHISRKFNGPILLFTYPYYNSLASGLEAFGKLRFTQKIKIAYGNMDFEEIERFYYLCRTLENLNALKVVSIGPPSKWLLTSENKTILGNFGLVYREISLDKFMEIFNKVSEKEVEKVKRNFKYKFPQMENLDDSLKVYVSLKKIIKELNVSAVTVRCFDLLKYKLTACLALAMLNSEGIVAGCEGDIQALITMIVAYNLTGKIPWMANPCQINYLENSITLAHCTIGFNLLEKNSIEYLPHMESGLGISLRGNITAKKGILLRMGSIDLSRIQLAETEVLESNFKDPRLCNVQLKVALDIPLKKWLNNTLGNHQIFVPEVNKEIFEDFAFFKNLEINK